MKVRKAKLKDLDEICNMAETMLIFHNSIDSFFSPNKKSKIFLHKYFKTCIYNWRCRLLVLEDKEKLIGYILASLRMRPPIFKESKMGFIEDLYISEKYRRSGYGKLLIEEIIKWCKNHKISNIELTVHSKNEIGKIAWKKYGFQEYMSKMRASI